MAPNQSSRRALLVYGSASAVTLGAGTGLLSAQLSDNGDDDADDHSDDADDQSDDTSDDSSDDASDDSSDDGDDADDDFGPGETHTVEIEDNAFSPSVLEIQAGDTVRFEHVGGIPHTATGYQEENGKLRRAPAGATVISSGDMNGGDTYEVTLTSPGVFDYFCAPHESQGMVGSIVVRGAGDDSPSQAGLSDIDSSNVVGDAVGALESANARARSILGLDGDGDDDVSTDVTIRAADQSGNGEFVTVQQFRSRNGSYVTVHDREYYEGDIGVDDPFGIHIGVTDFLEGSQTHTAFNLDIGNDAARTPQEGFVLDPEEDRLVESAAVALVGHQNESDPDEFDAVDLAYASGEVDADGRQANTSVGDMIIAYHHQDDPMEAVTVARDHTTDGSWVSYDAIYAVDSWMQSTHDCDRRLAGVLADSITGMDAQVSNAGMYTQFDQELFGPNALASPKDGAVSGDRYAESELLYGIIHENNTAVGAGLDANENLAYGDGPRDHELFPVHNHTFVLITEGDDPSRIRDMFRAKDLAREAMATPENLIRSTIASSIFIDQEERQEAIANLQAQGIDPEEPLDPNFQLADVMSNLSVNSRGV